MKLLVAASYLHLGLSVLETAGAVPEPDRLSAWARAIMAFHFRHAEHAKKNDDANNDEFRAAETVFNRLMLIQKQRRVPWTVFYHNSFLFVDLVFFLRWLKAPPGSDRESIRREAEEFRLVLLTVIVGAAHSDCEVGREETSMFNHFLASANLAPADRTSAKTLFASGLSAAEIELPKTMGWLLRKYLLEIALLTVWSDGELTRLEKAFVKTLGRRAGLSSDDQEASFVAVEAFVLEHWDDLDYLRDRGSYGVIRKHWVSRMKKAVSKYRAQVAQEISESRELVTLLRKSAREDLTPEEKEKVRAQLIDILKTIPTFALLLLPGAVLTLPLLYKILPKEFLLPSSFQDDD